MSKKIVVVDDEQDVIKSVKEGLEKSDKNLKVIGFDTGKKCLDYLKTCDNLPNVILIDIMMPEMDGWQLHNRIKEINKCKNIPLVFLTAKNDNFTVTFGRSQASDFIEKPFDINDLRRRLYNIFNKEDRNFLSIE